MISSPKISVCIPSYEAKGMGVKFISKNIESILSQNYKNIEIVISDHSVDDKIQNYVEGLSNENIKYLRNTENIGWPAHNTNNAIKNSSGDYIKLMNLDDFIRGEDTIKLIVDLINDGNQWVLSGFVHYDYDRDIYTKEMIPTILEDATHLIRGHNYVGCPSVGLIPKNEFFDTEVVYMIDCELWYRMFLKYGRPGILHEHRIVIGIGEHTLTNQLSSNYSELLNKDVMYCAKKFNT